MKSISQTPLTRFGRAIVALSLITTFLVCFTCCKKEKTQTDLLQQKWDHFTRTSETYDKVTNQPIPNTEPWNPISQNRTYTGLPGEYYDFQKNGTLTLHYHSNYLDYPYTFSETDMTLEYDGKTYNILELTNSTLVLFRKYDIIGSTSTYGTLTIKMWR
jgi:hypothetical protein